MNPFTTPDRIFISKTPQDMRAGIQRLASIVTTDFGVDPMDGSLFVFVSRDCLLLSIVLLLSIHGDRFVTGVAGRSATLSATCTTGAVTKPLPLTISADAPVMKILLSRIGFYSKRVICKRCDCIAYRVSYLQHYAETPRYQRDLCNSGKAKRFSGVELKNAQNEGKPRRIKESPLFFVWWNKQTLEKGFVLTMEKKLLFRNYISLGYFCEVAQDLEKLGLRNQSSPFDWGISSLPCVIKALENGFSGFLDYDNLTQNTLARNHYHDDLYDFFSFHDFDTHKSLSEQYPLVKEKYDRRVNRMLESIKEPTLFIRYISSEKQDGGGNLKN